MAGFHHQKIMAGRPASDFHGRDDEIRRLSAHAASTSGLLILSRPGAGASELLKQTYDRLFRDQQEIVPFYFAIRPSVASVDDIAVSFLEDFVQQLVAFRRQEEAIFQSPVGVDELAELSLSVGGSRIDRLIETLRTFESGSTGKLSRSAIRNCLAAPIRAATSDARAIVMVDDLHQLLNIDRGIELVNELRDLFAEAGVAFVFAGHRRFLYGRADCERIELDHPSSEHAGEIAEVFARESKVPMNESARDLIATQLGRSPSRMRQLIRSALDAGLELNSYEEVERAYADSLFGGRIGRDFDTLFMSSCRSPEIERRVVSMLFDCHVSDAGRVERERWHRRLQLRETDTEALLDRLNIAELVRLTPLYIEAVTEDVALADYVAARFRLASGAESRASIYSGSLSSFITRAPDLMARTYRVQSALGLRELLGAFAGQSVALSLLDYAAFQDSAGAGGSIVLPRIFFTTAASSFYKPIAQIAESARSAIAIGFEAPANEETNEEVVWIAAEVDSKLEASRELAEFWCDRLAEAASMCNFDRFRIWLVAREGFSPEALETLRQRNGFGSSGRQVGLLRKALNAPSPDSEELAENEYEMVIPMRDEAELIAAQAVAEIARRHNFKSKSINQIKTALVEACINASEHSLSPDGKIYQRFRVEDDRVVITVSNRGLRLNSSVTVSEPSEGRRGWGLKLMRRLMDEVRIENVDDGTRIVMTKHLKNEN